MKRIIAVLIVLLFFVGCSPYVLIGDLTVASNRNLENDLSQYKLLERNKIVEVRAENSMEAALDKATQEVPGGEFMKNVKVFVKENGKTLKLDGDVWGVGNELDDRQVSQSGFAIGDKVVFKRQGMKEGKVIGLDDEKAIVKYEYNGKERTIEIDYDKLTRIE